MNHCRLFLSLVVNDATTVKDLYSPCKRQPALGIESGTIPNTAFFASTFVEGREPFTARLNGRYGRYLMFSLSFSF